MICDLEKVELNTEEVLVYEKFYVCNLSRDVDDDGVEHESCEERECQEEN